MADFQIIDGLESRLSVNNVGDEYFTTWDTDVTIKHTGGGGNNYPDVIEREWKLEVVNGDVLLELTVDINPNEQDNNAENWMVESSLEADDTIS